MTEDKKQLVRELYKPFRMDEHEIRIGSTRNKAQWFVYVRREAITSRLDDLFPLDWADTIINITQYEKYATATMRLTISGISRENNGSQAGNGENAEKGAVTDAFKRVASSFGIGLYLQSSPQIWTAGGFADDKGRVNNWSEHNKQEKEALEKFAKWHRETFGSDGNMSSNGKDATTAATTTATDETWATSANLKTFFDLWNEQSLSDSDICRLAGINTSDEWGKKYQTGKDASAAIRAAMAAEIENNAEKSATFRYMSYVGSKGTLQFLTHPDGTKDNVLALLYEGRGGITKMAGNDELYNQLHLGKYDAVKGKNIVTDFIPMAVPVEFSYVTVTPERGDPYNKITGIVNVPEISF